MAGQDSELKTGYALLWADEKPDPRAMETVIARQMLYNEMLCYISIPKPTRWTRFKRLCKKALDRVLG